MEPLGADQLRQVATLQGYAWSDEELARIGPQVERGLALVEKLTAVVPPDLEPAIQYRMCDPLAGGEVQEAKQRPLRPQRTPDHRRLENLG